jgi:hypothetical protein
MSRYLHLVFSQPPEGVTDSDYDEWYDSHVDEILAVPGWESVRRYRVTPVVEAGDGQAFRYVAVYELSVEPPVAVAALEQAGMGNADSYVELKDEEGDSTPLPLPDWFTDVVFGSWNCEAVGDRIEAGSEGDR